MVGSGGVDFAGRGETARAVHRTAHYNDFAVLDIICEGRYPARLGSLDLLSMESSMRFFFLVWYVTIRRRTYAEKRNEK